MREIILLLKRTVFLPKGSPGICSVRDIKADVRHYETAAEGGRVFCSGEADLLIEYLSFAPGKHYPGYEDYEQQLSNGGSMWQALLTVPFELTGEGDLPCPPLAELACGEMNWFMVSPHALEMEIELCLSWQDDLPDGFAAATEAPGATPRQPAGWQQVTLADVERQGAQQPKLNKTKEECLNMEHGDKVMRMGVSDQGWQITSQGQEQILAEQVQPEACEVETSILSAAIEEVTQQRIVVAEETTVEETAVEKTAIEKTAIEEIAVAEIGAEEIVVAEITVEEVVLEEIITAEAIAEETAVEKPPLKAAPLLNIQTVETPWQTPSAPEAIPQAPVMPQPMESPASRSRAAGLPRLHVRHEQMRHSSYQVNFQIEDK